MRCVDISIVDMIAWQCWVVAQQRVALEDEAQRDDWHGQVVRRLVSPKDAP